MNSNDFIKYDFRASLVVVLVALPLCLGIALASGAPIVSGIIAGIVGGIVVGMLSGSSISVSGPAAGLTTIVAMAITRLGTFESFLLCLALAGVFQIALGFLRAGAIGNFFPASIVKGMLAAIGLILILKQIPHATGYDFDFEGDESFVQPDGRNTFSEIVEAISTFRPAALLISALSLLVLYVWDRLTIKKSPWAEMIPAPVLVVLAGTGINLFFTHYAPGFSLSGKHLVTLPFGSDGNSASWVTLPDFGSWNNPQVWKIALTLALVASLETLLSIEACDKLDPKRGMTPLNRELKAQGVGNLVSGLLGGLPITSVIVRSSANIDAGARSKASAIMHGFFLLLAVLLIPFIIELIPLASLAGLLIGVGFKLTNPRIYREMYRKGMAQFLPFSVTIVAVLLTDLLQGVFLGILVAVFFILKTNFGSALILVNSNNSYLLRLTKDISFLNKSTLRTMLRTIPANAHVLIDGSDARFVDQDIKETIGDFIEASKTRNIQIELKNIILHA